MGTALLLILVLGALLVLVTFVIALRAGLGMLRARARLQKELSVELERRTLQTGQLEKELAALDARAKELPVQISELQRNLATLQVLTGALGASLQQAQNALTYSGLKTFGTAYLGERFGHYTKRRGRAVKVPAEETRR
jgi:cell division protein FtsB